MLALAISLIIWVLLFSIAGWGMYACCKKFELPQPALWICGGLLLIAILIALAKAVDGSLPVLFHGVS